MERRHNKILELHAGTLLLGGIKKINGRENDLSVRIQYIFLRMPIKIALHALNDTEHSRGL